MLENAKKKIELKYLTGNEHLVHLSSNKDRERRGLIREINLIPPNSSKNETAFALRAQSVNPNDTQ